MNSRWAGESSGVPMAGLGPDLHGLVPFPRAALLIQRYYLDTTASVAHRCVCHSSAPSHVPSSCHSYVAAQVFIQEQGPGDVACQHPGCFQGCPARGCMVYRNTFPCATPGPPDFVWVAKDNQEDIRLVFSGNSMVPQEAASVVESEGVLYLHVNQSVCQVNKSLCQGFKDVGRRHHSSGSMTKDLIAPGTGPA